MVMVMCSGFHSRHWRNFLSMRSSSKLISALIGIHMVNLIEYQFYTLNDNFPKSVKASSWSSLLLRNLPSQYVNFTPKRVKAAQRHLSCHEYEVQVSKCTRIYDLMSINATVSWTWHPHSRWAIVWSQNPITRRNSKSCKSKCTICLNGYKSVLPFDPFCSKTL